MKMELKHCLQLCCFIAVVQGRPMESDPDKRNHYCGTKISEMIDFVCLTTNHASGSVGGSKQGRIVDQCCAKPCSLREISEYCNKIRPEIEMMLNLSRNSPPLSNSIIQDSSDQVEDTLSTTRLPPLRTKVAGKYRKVLHPTVYKSAEVGFDTSSSTFIINTPYNHNEFLPAI